MIHDSIIEGGVTSTTTTYSFVVEFVVEMSLLVKLIKTNYIQRLNNVWIFYFVLYKQTK